MRIKGYAQKFDTNDLFEKVREWGYERGLDSVDPNKQALKLGEEYGELCEALLKDDQEKIEDSIGDMMIVLINLSMALNMRAEVCFKDAYNVIKHREGKTINGVFIKEEDL